MLKKKTSIIILLIVLILALTLPVVRAENETADTNSENQDVTALTSPDSSMDTENSESEVTILENETSDSEDTEADFKEGDVYLAGDDITIDYIIDGNLFIFADSVTINSQIGGDAFIFAKSVTIGEQGYIFSNLFTVAENIDIKGVAYDLYSVSKNINISGYIYRDIKVVANTLNILGTVGRNAFVECSDIQFGNQEADSSEGQNTITSNGSISGDLNYTSKNELNIPDDKVGGNINFTQKVVESSNTINNKIFDLGSFIVTVILIWLVLLWIAPKFVKSCNQILTNKPLPVIGLGILTPIAFIFAFIILLLLNITVAFSFLSLAVFCILLLVSSSIFVIAINNMLCTKLKINKNVGIFGMLIVSAIVLWLIKLIPILGTLVSFIVSILGLGIIVSNLILKNSENTPKQ